MKRVKSKSLGAVAGLLAVIAVGCAGDGTPLLQDEDTGDPIVTDTEIPDVDASDAGDPDVDPSDADDPDADADIAIGPILELGDDLSLSAMVDEVVTAELDVANSGDQPLALQVSTSNPALEVTPAHAEIAPGQASALAVTAECTRAGFFTYLISVSSNDPQSSDAQVQVELTCEAIPLGQLSLSARGLPAGQSFAATVTGPGGFEQAVTGPIALPDLDPGDYRVSFADVAVTPAIYRADAVDVSVSADAGAVAQADYIAAEGTLALSFGLPAGNAASFKVVDALGQNAGEFSTNGPGGATVELAPGNYRVRLAGSAPVDTWGNPLEFEGLEQDVQVASEQTTSFSIHAYLPTLVRTAVDGAPGSLRAIVGAVNAGSTVSFAPGVGTLTLGAPALLIDRALTLEGRGIGQTVLRGDGSAGLFEINAPDEVSFQDMTLSHGAADDEGGAIRAQSPVSLLSVSFEDNSAARGGALALAVSQATAVAIDVRFLRNSATGHGGALYADASLELEDALFEGNSAGNDGGALFANSGGCQALTLERALFTENQAGAHGGGVRSACAATVVNTTFDGNSAAQRGGAYYQFDGAATLSFVTITRNRAAEGAGLASYGDSATSVDLLATILAGNSPTGNDLNELSIATTGGPNPVSSSGYNYIGRTSTGAFTAAPTDTLSTGVALPLPVLGLADNGGFSPTAAVAPAFIAALSLPASACLNAAGQPLTLDQRAQTRPDGAFCTAGAWEAQGAGGSEDFEAHNLIGSSYSGGSFVGNQGVTWSYSNARNETTFPIEGKGILLQFNGSLGATGIPGGVDTLLLDVRKAFTSGTARTLEVYINGELVGQTQPFGEVSGADATVHTLELRDLGVSGAFDLELRNPGGSAQLVIDNLRWR
ncbi:hypothetical protein DL240_15525 [Lujinxingia litoralis]|uniref:HYDIN/VesB/CFA65-like Ig-like domain-containing protein n=1 Tax=Lujinxingia litoralis TaxID=2211119 RepID=A0A328C5Y3_9DELT|nr:hypothetical protein [Lujinxingia litoralis]RAL20726.1 hypothetical protein DL240_15525 [Lujinxingia litoralis]